MILNTVMPEVRLIITAQLLVEIQPEEREIISVLAPSFAERLASSRTKVQVRAQEIQIAETLVRVALVKAVLLVLVARGRKYYVNWKKKLNDTAFVDTQWTILLFQAELLLRSLLSLQRVAVYV